MVVAMRPQTAWSSPSLVLSSGKLDGGEGVAQSWAGKRLVVAVAMDPLARWTRIRSIITAFSLSKDDEGEGVELQEET